MKIIYKTNCGIYYSGEVEKVLNTTKFSQHKGKINLVLTSPPFPLNRKKRYGNLNGQEYVKWLSKLSLLLRKYLTDDGSIVIELGNSWIKGKPVMSTLALRALLEFLEEGNYYLCQQFIWYNPARLPSPAQWVNIERIRVKDSFTHIWWMSKTEYPKANNENVLTEYSNAMKNLLKKRKYNYGLRPSEHNIGEISFLKDNKGAIPSNVITVSNTQSNSKYQKYCKRYGYIVHPARMPLSVAEFFIKFLTEPEDIVLDPFGGSNTTGFVAENLKRRWISIEQNIEYVKGSRGHFSKESNLMSYI